MLGTTQPRWLIWILFVLGFFGTIAVAMLLAMRSLSPFGWAGRTLFALQNWLAGVLLGPADPEDRAEPHRRGLFERRPPAD